jgi:hypothetical protein
MSTTTSVAGGRDRGGKFAKGNPGGPGRPPRATEANYLLALTDVVPLDRWRKIVVRIADRAEDGDLKAAQWLGRVVLGADPGRLSEAVAGVLHAGPHYRVAEQLDERVKDEDDVYDEILDPDGELRQARVRALVETLGDPGDPGDHAAAGAGVV